MPLTDAGRIPVATFRVQLNPAFTFRDLDAQVSYLRSLGISDFYLSPIFAASPGSLHGYDVNDYGTVNPELGGREGFERLTDRLRAENAGVLLDMVPNHMGIAGLRNAWWRDVLTWGQRSAYAPFFDIRWSAGGDRVLLPLLTDHYGRELEQGKISVGFDRGFFLSYAELNLPVTPESQANLLQSLNHGAGLPAGERAEAAAFSSDFTRLAQFPGMENREQARDRAQRMEHARTRLGDWVKSRPAVRAQLDGLLRDLNGTPGKPGSFSALHALIEAQHYRLARWKAGTHEINYRRFFAISSLVGLKMENPEVFRESHALLAHFLREGRVTGLRIDHIDGLREPAGYLRRLQGLEHGPREAPLYVVVEKILAGTEKLPPETWAAHGTTGYEFIPQLAALLVDGSAAPRFTATYQRFTGEAETYADAVYARKRLILDELFSDTVIFLGAELAGLMTADWQWQDLTAHELATAVRELMATLPVYRTYRENEGPVDAMDRAVLDTACREAIARNPRLDPGGFEFVRALLAGDYPPDRADPEFRRRLLGWVLTFQQYTGAVMAKAVEDTVFYTYCRFIALNEVGGSPAQFGGTVHDFHEANRRRLESTPHSLLATSTHDTKLSEDVRARLYALSELGEEWDGWVERWHALNQRHLTAAETGAAPDRRDEYRFYQILLGLWPLETAGADDAWRGRLRQQVRKAVDEAKRHTSPLQPNEPYLQACDRFVNRVTSADFAAEFLADFAPCAAQLAQLGMINSLAQLTLKCTVPGVPDFYQGNDVWDFSLVDPDNRRPVDYDRRHRLLAEAADRPLSALMEHWRDGAIKQHVMQRLLQFRATVPELFRAGDYQPVVAEGKHAAHVVAFLRRWRERALLVVVPRLTALIGQPPLGPAWDDTALTIAGAQREAWRDRVTGRLHSGTTFPLSELLAELPLAVLEQTGTGGKEDR